MTTLNQRRKFLLSTSQFALMGAIASSGCAQNRPIAQDKNPLLRSLVETILPRDDFPGALDLGYDRKLGERMRMDEKISALVKLVIEGVNANALQSYGAAFNSLGIDEREHILNAILDSQHQVPLRRALQQIRILVFKWFYASEVGQRSLDYLAPSRYPAYMAGRKIQR